MDNNRRITTTYFALIAMNLSRKTFIKSLLNVLGFTVVAPFVFAENSPKHNISDLSLEQEKEFVKSINESLKKIGFQFKDCDGNCEKIYKALENTFDTELDSVEVRKDIVELYATLAENLKKAPDAKRMLKEHFERILSGGGLTGNEEDEIKQIQRENRNNPNYFLFDHDGGLGVEIERAKSKFQGDREARQNGASEIEKVIFYNNEVATMIADGKTKYLDKGNFDGTKSTGGKDSYVPVANDELIGLMAEYNP
ncbi:hypothetical protein [Runella sp.]|uniref:hypothetical protein n=1 Tax=Runella sp. TaxID=1960881 RepID=UPI00301952B5